MTDLISLQTTDIVKLIKNALERKISISIIRYGDGESMMFNGVKEDAHFILKKVLGYIPEDHEITMLKSHLIDAYRHCDIIGIPTERHLRREDRWGQSLDVFNLTMGEKVLESKHKTSVDIFHNMLTEGVYSELLTGLDTLNYISCRNLDDVFKEKFGIKNVNSFIISPEPTYTSGYVGDKHYPEQFNQIAKWIRSLQCEGQLCLVGAGIPGKIYNNWFRDQGGVSLDIGSVFDSFSGHKTRGKGRGLDVIDNTYKL